MNREERLAKNETLFRDVNERVREISEGAWNQSEPAEFLCECAVMDCLERVTLPLAVYEDVRADPAHFFVLKGHERPDIEFVVAVGESYVVVEKNDETKHIVTENDPRS